MDFHALPRRDLQALCKRNGIRANMTNVAMADALAALPAVVDGIEKEAAAAAAASEEGEMQGISLPGGHGVALTPHEVIILDDSEDEDKDLMPDWDEEKTPALSVGRRRASRRARVEPVTAPATRKRAAASMAETGDAAAEAVPARTTRARSLRAVVSAPEEETPKARRTSTRAEARKTNKQEEEEKETQGDVASGCVVDSSVQERQADVSSEEIHHVSEDTEMVSVNEVPLAMVKSGEAAEDVDFTSEENEIPTSGERLQSSAKAIEEKEDIAADEMANNTEMSVEEEAVVATGEMPQRSATVEEGVIELVTVDNLSQATITDGEGVFKESGFTTDLTDVSIEEKAVVATDEMPLSLATMDESVKEEAIPVDYLSQVTVTDDEGAVKESGFSCDPTGGSVEEKGVLAASSMPQTLATLDDSVEQVVTIDNLSQATLTDDESTVKESGFNCDLADVSVEEDAVVAADEMSQRSAILDESVKGEVATVENLSQATLTDDEWVLKESPCAGDLLPVVENLSQATVTDDEWVVKESAFAGDLPPVVENLSQATVTDDEWVVKESAFAGDLPLVVENLSQATVMDGEWVVKESAFAGDLPPVVDTARGFGDHIASPLSTGMLEIATKSMSIDSITVEPMVSEAVDVPLRMHSNSGGKKNATELVAVEGEKEGKECEALGSLSLRKLRIKLKEKVSVEREKEMKEGMECEASGSLSLRKFRIKLKEKVAVAQEKADDVPLCMYSSSGGEKNASEPVTLAREGEMKEGKESEALGSLSLRKLRTKLKEKVKVTQENEVKEGKKSMAVDKLSLRKLKMKLKEMLNAQKVISKSQP